MRPHALRLGISMAAVILSVGCSSVSFAQDYRSNPFLPETTAEEQAIIAERERIRQSIREMMPEIKSLLAASFDEQKQQIIAEMAEGGVTVSAGATTDSAGNPISPSTQAAAPASAIPEGSKFVGCINGKALYRDQNGVKFFDETPGAATVCP